MKSKANRTAGSEMTVSLGRNAENKHEGHDEAQPEPDLLPGGLHKDEDSPYVEESGQQFRTTRYVGNRFGLDRMDEEKAGRKSREGSRSCRIFEQQRENLGGDEVDQNSIQECAG